MTKLLAALGAALAAAAAWAAIAPAQREEPADPSRWVLVVGGPQGDTLQLSQVVALTTELVPGGKRSLPGDPQRAVAVLRRGLDGSRYAWEWHAAARANAPGAMRDADLLLLTGDGGRVAQWNLVNAWPKKVEAADIRAHGNEVAIEELVLVAESVERVAP